MGSIIWKVWGLGQVLNCSVPQFHGPSNGDYDIFCSQDCGFNEIICVRCSGVSSTSSFRKCQLLLRQYIGSSSGQELISPSSQTCTSKYLHASRAVATDTYRDMAPALKGSVSRRGGKAIQQVLRET